MLFLILLFSLSAGAADHIPPKTLYHMGEKAYLLEDDKLGTISEEVWKKNIMGSGTTFGLVPYRRGLYGGEAIDCLAFYGNMYLGSPGGIPKKPWLMRITIKDECLKPEAVSDLASDDKYMDWLLRHINLFVKDASSCLDSQASACSELIVGTQPVSNGTPANKCDDIMESFMSEYAPKVVKDTAWPRAWYLRDRDCIEKLEAKPETVLEALSIAKWDWGTRRSTFTGDNGAPYGLVEIALLSSALAEAQNPDPTVLRSIRKLTAASNIHMDMRDESPEWVKVAGPALIDAYERCSKAGKLSDFRKENAEFEAVLSQPVKFRTLRTVDSLMRGMAAVCN